MLAQIDINRETMSGNQLSNYQQQLKARNDAARRVLKEMASKLCRHATVAIVACFSEFADGHKYSLKNHLQTIFGPDKTIQTFKGLCGVKFGSPTENVY
jgi:hypothetical protein